MKTWRTMEAKQKSAKALAVVIQTGKARERIVSCSHNRGRIRGGGAGTAGLPFRRDDVPIFLVPSWCHLRPQTRQQYKLSDDPSETGQEPVERVTRHPDPVRHQEDADDDEKGEEAVDEFYPDRSRLGVSDPEGSERAGEGIQLSLR